MPYDTFIHRLDPRNKLLALILLMIPIFLSFANPETNFIIYGVMAIVFFILMRIAHIRLSMIFKQLKTLWVMMLFILIINLIFIKDESFGIITIPYIGIVITVKAIYDTVFIALRLILMVALSTILTSTTKPLDLTFALEWYLTPLKVFHFPTVEIAMTISLALRFIPTFIDETNRIMKAQASRGVDFAHGKLKEKMKAIISLIIPLLSSALQKSEELANALVARGYDPEKKRTHYRIVKWHFADTICLLLCVVYLGGMITCASLHIDIFNIIKGWF